MLVWVVVVSIVVVVVVVVVAVDIVGKEWRSELNLSRRSHGSFTKLTKKPHIQQTAVVRLYAHEVNVDIFTPKITVPVAA